RHRKAAFLLAAAPSLRDTLELRELVTRQRRQWLDAHRVAGTLETAHRLADLTNRAALEIELRRIDHGFVAGIERAQPRLLVERQQCFARTEHGEAQTALLGERTGSAQQIRERGRRADRIARDQQDACVDPVGQERSPVLREQAVRIAAELEEG